MNDVETQRKNVEQLRIENNIKRQKTSKTIEELKRYCLENQESDHLIIGFNKKDGNPYKPKNMKCDVM
jgi:hypothetical protein